MPADRPRAFEYRGPGEYVEGIPFGRTYEASDHYVVTFKMHPDDVELVCPAVPDPMPAVKGNCPTCGRSTLFVASGGYLTCSSLECPNPTALADSLEGRT